ncbi:hypothetical protein ACNFB1_11990 [Pseudomonas sp. NY15349]|uniref:hypothetical protein n=1 Tax=Pseudomonas sp. NY15349 TaxID=3400350 RepID=UPI003A87A8EA
MNDDQDPKASQIGISLPTEVPGFLAAFLQKMLLVSLYNTRAALELGLAIETHTDDVEKSKNLTRSAIKRLEQGITEIEEIVALCAAAGQSTKDDRE